MHHHLRPHRGAQQEEELTPSLESYIKEVRLFRYQLTINITVTYRCWLYTSVCERTLLKPLVQQFYTAGKPVFMKYFKINIC